MADVILDTDAYNEIDDQFAIAWLLREKGRVNIKALTAAPFFNSRSTSPEDGMEKSYYEILNLLDLAGENELSKRVFRGSTRYLQDEKTPVESSAAMEIVRLAREYTHDKPLHVLAIGAITNVASALLLDPTIAERIVVIWLGGNGHHAVNNHEFNCSQDVAAARVVFDKAVNLVQLPCRGIVDHLTTSEPELRQWLGEKNALCDYLVQQTVDEAETYAKGKPWTRVIWDISTVAWLLDVGREAVFDVAEHRPIPEYGHYYSFSSERRPYNYVIEINRDKIFEKLFKALVLTPCQSARKPPDLPDLR